MNKSLNGSAKQESLPLFRGGKETAKYTRRWAVATFVGVVAAVGALEVAKTIYDVGSPSTIAEKLAQSYEKDQAAVHHGEFEKGSVIKVPLIAGRSAYENAVNLAGSGYSPNEADIQTDIQHEVGGVVPVGQDSALLDRSEVPNPPPGSVVQ